VTPDQFIAKWKVAELKERSAAQSHFIDLCGMLDEPGPTDADPMGEWYSFERGATKTTGGEGWADVWKRGHFGWEYKGKRKDLDAAFAQLQQYALALENPPLLVVCDLNRFRIRTNWTNSISEAHEFALDDLRDATVRQKLKWVLSDPERLKPSKTRQALTEQAAAEFAKLAQRLRGRGHPSEAVAHFINRLVFCMFAEDVDLLPNKMFKRMLEHALMRPDEFRALASDLFLAMKAGGRVGFESVAWFNGGLFNDDAAMLLDKDDIALTLRAADLDWAEIDPSIFGTLFERGLDPDKRSQLGAHYTDRDKIMLIVAPVIVRPWLAEWEAAKTGISSVLTKAQETKSASARTKARDQAVSLYRAFLDRLRGFRVLDPACGSGNFLYLALLALKDLEHRAGIEAEAMGLQREFPQIGPVSVKGIEINPYAAELARVSVWIGEIQWMRRNGFGVSRDPILKPLETIECRDAILNEDGTEATWPDADVVISNPPFLGSSKFLGILGRAYTLRLRRLYAERAPGAVDLYVYWFAKALDHLKASNARRIGLVAKNTFQQKANSHVLRDIEAAVGFFNADTQLPWVNEGAAVVVHLICFGFGSTKIELDGRTVERITWRLTSGKDPFGDSQPKQLLENRHICFNGVKRNGPFDIDGKVARQWLREPTNPNGELNSCVLSPYVNGDDLTGRLRDRWLIDFGFGRSEQEIALFESPFAYAERHVKPARANARRPVLRDRWWEFEGLRKKLRKRLADLDRYIALSEKSHQFVWAFVDARIILDNRLIVVARSDLCSFGIIQWRLHERWMENTGSLLEDRRCYTPTTTFATFPFPKGLTPDIPAADFAGDPRAIAIAEAAKRLNELREAWLNPADLVERVPEVVAGFPDRIMPMDDKAASILKKRTLTNLYNERPAWLANAHRDLDATVAEAYGWPGDISDEDALGRLFALNQSQSASH
jgi:type II restriction/modification system DNA methylase subunit YeeA